MFLKYTLYYPDKTSLFWVNYITLKYEIHKNLDKNRLKIGSGETFLIGKFISQTNRRKTDHQKL